MNEVSGEGRATRVLVSVAVVVVNVMDALFVAIVVNQSPPQHEGYRFHSSRRTWR